jgi:hypothetical protein
MALVTAGLVIQGNGRSAFVAPGYVTSLNSAEFQDAISLYPLKGGLTDAQFDRIVTWHTRPQAIDAAIAAIPDLLPVEVQGASEEFITNVMGQVVANANTNANTINANNVIMRDQVKQTVNQRADEIIAKLG